MFHATNASTLKKTVMEYTHFLFRVTQNYGCFSSFDAFHVLLALFVVVAVGEPISRLRSHTLI